MHVHGGPVDAGKGCKGGIHQLETERKRESACQEVFVLISQYELYRAYVSSSCEMLEEQMTTVPWEIAFLEEIGKKVTRKHREANSKDMK